MGAMNDVKIEVHEEMVLPYYSEYTLELGHAAFGNSREEF